MRLGTAYRIEQRALHKQKLASILPPRRLCLPNRLQTLAPPEIEMAIPENAYYEFYRRQHRVLGAYLALHCWHNGFDAVIVSRETLAHMHELKKFTSVHLTWLERDVRPYFPVTTKLYYTEQRNKFAAVVLSRIPLPKHFGTASLKDEDRAQFWRRRKFRVAALSELRGCDTMITEKSAATFLSQVGVGLAVPMVANSLS